MMSCQDGEGLLCAESLVLVQTTHPLETISSFAESAIQNMTEGVQYCFVLPAGHFRRALDLLKTLKHTLSQNDDAPRPDDWQWIAARVRILLSPHGCRDSLYVLNADNEHLAVSYLYCHQSRQAARGAERVLAVKQAQDLLRAFQDSDRLTIRRGDPVIQFGNGVRDKADIYGELMERFQAQFPGASAESKSCIFGEPPQTLMLFPGEPRWSASSG